MSDKLKRFEVAAKMEQLADDIMCKFMWPDVDRKYWRTMVERLAARAYELREGPTNERAASARVKLRIL